LTLEVVKRALEIVDIPELHDRLIAGTAKLLGGELITNDPVIEKSTNVKTLWKQ
jgi:predicted nucleic acid-binding protein